MVEVEDVRLAMRKLSISLEAMVELLEGVKADAILSKIDFDA